MRDARVGEHALHVGLDERHDVADRHRQDRQPDQDLEPADRHAAGRWRKREVTGVEGYEQHPQEDGEARRLHGGGHVGRHRCRRALVDVRGPHVERDEGELEAEAHEDEQHPNEHEGLVGQPGQCCGDTVEARRTGQAPDERDAVDEDRGSECAEQEVLQAGLCGPVLAAEVRRQGVDGHAHRLEPEEQHDQVARVGHEQHAQGAEQKQGVVLAARQAPPVEIAGRQHAGEPGAEQDQGVEEEREAIQDDGAAEQRPDGFGGLPLPSDDEQGDQDAAERKPHQPATTARRAVRAVLFGIAGEGVAEKHRQRGHEEDQQGQKGEGVLERVHRPTPCPDASARCGSRSAAACGASPWRSARADPCSSCLA